MTAENFDRCLAEVLKHEGGLVHNPNDPGGLTNMGVSQRSYPNEDIKGMTRARAAEIYRRDFWDAVRGDDLPRGLDLVAFDAAVNSGASRGVKWVQQAVGAKVDGAIGPATIAAASSVNQTKAIIAATDARLAFMRNLSIWPTFGKGWQRRVDSVRTTALAMIDPAAEAAPADDALVALVNWRAAAPPGAIEWLRSAPL